MPYSGFCTGGLGWPFPEITEASTPEELQAARRRIAADDARVTHDMGGNMIRLFWAIETVVRGDARDLARAVAPGAPGRFDDGRDLADNRGLQGVSSVERIEELDRVNRTLDALLEVASGREHEGFTLDLGPIEDLVTGVRQSNREHGSRVRVLLTAVMPAPRLILETPSRSTLRAQSRTYDFTSLWDRYVEVQVELHRRICERFARSADGSTAVIAAIEVGNEPDYVWLPEDQKLEGSLDPSYHPLAKYVGELHAHQVPEDSRPYPAHERAPFGFQAEDAEWNASPRAPVGVTAFDWGPKFDWYVRHFGDLQARIARAVHEAAPDLTVVSGSVTHNNVDYLIRMQRGSPRAFEDIDAIGIHPYHWRHNDVWDTDFVSDDPMDDWARSSPRAFALDYFKRFDFLEVLAACTEPSRRFARRNRVPEDAKAFAAAVSGRTLWITEFGFGSKVLGRTNTPVAEYTRFIRPRAAPGVAAGYSASVLEDLWETWLDQVDERWLRERRVESFLLYTLREAGVAGLDMDDEDRSNLAILHRDGSPRLAPATDARVRTLLGAFSGASPSGAGVAVGSPGDGLHRRPWRSASVPAEVFAAQTMLSEEERRLLWWLTAHWFEGAGAIVDGGCFVGGSTVALAHGLRASRHTHARIDVYDLFVADAWEAEAYFADQGLRDGDSFRPLFDRTTADVADLLDVHEGDVRAAGWDGRPIEILFVDFAKSWELNDFVAERFFSALIPGRSVVVQQDEVFPFCPWIAITMEYLRDCFEPVAFAEHNSMVYLCRRVPDGSVATRDLPPDDQLRLLGQAAARHRGWGRAQLELAIAVLEAQLGDAGRARTRVQRVREEHGPGPLLDGVIAQVASAVGA